MSEGVAPSFTWGHKIFLSLGIPLALLVALESVCRIVNIPEKLADAAQPMQLEMPTWMLNDSNAMANTTLLVENPAAIDWLSMFEEGDGYRVRLIPGISRSVTNTFSQIVYDKSAKYAVQANSIGFRGPELTPQKPPGVLRVMVFGDSSSFGWGVNQDEMFSTLLSKLLQERVADKLIEVGNFAIPGDSSEYGRLLFDKFIPRFEADIIILGFGANDAKPVFTPHTAQVDKFRDAALLYRINQVLRGSSLIGTMQSILRPKEARQLPTTELSRRSVAVPKKRYRVNLNYMAEKSLLSGSKAAMVLNICTPGNYAKAAKNLASQNKLLYFNGQRYLVEHLPEIKGGKIHPQYVAEMKRLYAEDLERNPLFFITSDGCHPNKLGHRIIAEQLADIIAAALSNKPA